MWAYGELGRSDRTHRSGEAILKCKQLSVQFAEVRPYCFAGLSFMQWYACLRSRSQVALMFLERKGPPNDRILNTYKWVTCLSPSPFWRCSKGSGSIIYPAPHDSNAFGMKKGCQALEHLRKSVRDETHGVNRFATVHDTCGRAWNPWDTTLIQKRVKRTDQRCTHRARQRKILLNS